MADQGRAVRLKDNQGGEAWAHREEVIPVEEAAAFYSGLIVKNPTNAWVWNQRGNAWAKKKDYAKAGKDFDEALKLDPADPFILESKAYFLATCPDATFRDGAKALELAKKACELTSWKDGWMLRCLGAAYAELGQFEAAVEWQTKALEDSAYAAEEDEKAEAQERLKKYKAKQPWRMP